MLVPTARTYNATLAASFLTDAEFLGVSQSPERKALAADSSEATGATNPFVRAKVNVAYGYGLTGAGIKVGIIDSGWNLVAGKPQHNEFNGTGKFNQLVANPTTASDAHGPNVSGLAVANRDGSVMQGIAYNASIYYGDANPSGPGLKATFDEFTASGVNVSSNSYGIPVLGDANSPWKPVATTKDDKTGVLSYEVTSKNVIAYRDSKGISSAQALADVQGGTAADWAGAVASLKAFQDKGGVVVWANSNYGPNQTSNATAPADLKGLDDADVNSSVPLLFPELKPGWITVVNGTSRGLAVQAQSQGFVDGSTTIENNIFLYSANCGLAASFCLTQDGVASWSASNTGIASYTSQSGTSQATPEVAGMIALLREAFPTASAADLTARLLYTADNSFFTTNTKISTISTASYTNANGTITHRVSNIWGHGFPNLQAALNPVGVTATVTATGRSVSVASIAGTVELGSAFGGGSSALAGATYLYNDQLNGVFVGSIAGHVDTAAENTLALAVGERMIDQNMAVVETGKGLTLSFGQAIVPDSSGRYARLGSAFSIAQRVGANGRVAFGSGLNVDNGLGFASRHATLRSASISDRAMGIPLLSIGNRPQNWAATGWQNASIRTTFAAFATAGSVDTRRSALLGNGGRNDGFVADVVLGRTGRLQVNVSGGQMRERDAFLGSRASTTFFGASAVTRFGRIGVLAPLGGGFALQANYVTAFSAVRTRSDGLFAGFSQQRSESAGISLIADDVVTRNSRLTFGVSQPLRLARGTASLNLPQKVLLTAPGEYSYIYEANGVNLAPSGRELRYTIDFDKRLTDRARFSLSGMAISQPGHNAAAPMGVAGMASVKVAF